MRKPKVKYVVFKNIRQEHIVIFPEILTHIELADSITKMSEYMKPISAGFIDDGKCIGESISLDIKSRGEVDTLLLKELMKTEHTNKLISKIPEVNPHCPECKGAGVVLYNYWGEAASKDDDEFLNPDVREEPCPKCEEAKLA